MQYSDEVISHFYAPKNLGTLDENDPGVGTGTIGSPACGDLMRLQIKVNDDGIIEDTKFKAYGCGAAIASSSIATEWLKGKTLEEARQIKNSDIAEYLALPNIKIHCSILAEDVIKSAIDNYLSKQNKIKED
jgi:nitrogen fixation protein NifU and related proteins